MRTSRRFWTGWTAAVLAGAAGLAGAESFPGRVAPAGVQWIAHLDLAAFRETAFGKAVIADPRVAGSPQKAELAERLGLDPARDIQSLTLYAAGTNRTDAVAVIVPEPAAAERVAAWRSQTNLAAETYGRHTIYRRSLGDGMPFRGVTPDGRLVAALTRDQVARALDLLDGKAPVLTPAAFPAWAEGRAGVFLRIGGRQLGGDVQRIMPQATLLREARELVLLLGESDGRLWSVLVMQTDHEAAAERLQAALQGAIEIGRVMAANEGKGDLFRSLAVTRDGAAIRGTAAWPVAELLQALWP